MKYHVTYFYLATGMEGEADTFDHGVVEAESKEEAREIIINRSYSEGYTNYDKAFIRSCLSVESVEG